jgi:predicted nucleic acid-binding protein
MRDYFDSSVLVAAISKEEPNHESCTAAWLAADARIFLF